MKGPTRQPRRRGDGDDARLGHHPPMWLSHHWPPQYNRCVAVGEGLVCRRCLVLYPGALVVAVVVAAAGGWPDGAWWILAALPAPAAIELVGEHLAGRRYSPARQVAVTVPLAVACGGLLLRWFDRFGDPFTLAVVGGWGALTLAAVVLGGRKQRPVRHRVAADEGRELIRAPDGP